MAQPASPSTKDASQLDRLRRMLEQTAPYRPSTEVETGIEAFDRVFGGLPKGGLVVVRGLPGSGRTSLAAQMMGRATQSGQAVAWIDGRGTLYPPALEEMDVVLSRLLVIRTEPDRACYAAEQLLESGLFSMVALSGLDSALHARRYRRIHLAAETGQSSGIIITRPHHQRGGERPFPVALDLLAERRPGGGILLSSSRGTRSFIQPANDIVQQDQLNPR